MADSIKTIFNNFRHQSTLYKLIIINAVAYITLAVINVFTLLFELKLPDLRSYIGVSSNIWIVLTHFWTLLTYMFVHFDFLHILFNMLMLFSFGRIFLMYFSTKNLVGLYILGGLAGAFFYILTFNTIPYFINQGDSYMIGASASVMAIIFAAAFYNKNMEVRLFFIGQIKIYYIALALFIFDFIALGKGSNLGGHIAHIGGAALGYLYSSSYLKGKDITKGINLFIDKIVNLFKPKPRMKVTFNKRDSDEEYNQRKHNNTVEIDRILDKIKQSGYASLNDQEKKRLFDASNK